MGGISERRFTVEGFKRPQTIFQKHVKNPNEIQRVVLFQHNVSQARETESAAWRAGTGLYEYVCTCVSGSGRV